MILDSRTMKIHHTTRVSFEEERAISKEETNCRNINHRGRSAVDGEERRRDEGGKIRQTTNFEIGRHAALLARYLAVLRSKVGR